MRICNVTTIISLPLSPSLPSLPPPSPSPSLPRLTVGLLMVLTAAFEFNPQYSKLLPPRPTDDEELNEVINIPNISQMMI